MTTDPSSGQPGENPPTNPGGTPPPPPPPGQGYPQYPSGPDASGYPQYPAGQQPPPGYGYGPQPTQNDSNTMSIIAIVLGIVAILFLPIIFGPIAIILAVIGKRRGERLSTTALWVAIGGMIAGFIIGAIVYSSMVA